MPVPSYTSEQSADQYEQWQTSRSPGRTGKCPDCAGVVRSKSQPGLGQARTRMFECTKCGKVGIHEVPNEAPRRLGEDSLDPGPDNSLGRGRQHG